ncbi:hypothetical protein DRA67_08275 [Neisseria meningitidis]|nr:hypothetical protein DRA65_08355 [Neisseria meningitidis]QPH63352.1 hypothetical protein DRA66_08290 [Neisseria meningitidis]QPH65491.1 hypothetical protein DRA67_08275 [Neisseria meningitidis]QPH67655.1 hypothetical protein DRA68_08470 [Neisseria meningitidis]QPH69844.1 hypothetical protein DRA71_08390 [Neisseria meningitidis]
MPTFVGMTECRFVGMTWCRFVGMTWCRFVRMTGCRFPYGWIRHSRAGGNLGLSVRKLIG